MNIRLLLRRTVMCVLFIGALYTTITSITNMTITDMKRLNNQAKTVQATVVDTVQHVKKETYIQEKSLPVYDNHKQLTNVQSLEKVLNLDQYPQATVTATGYTAGVESTGKTPDHPGYGITFSGVEVTRDIYSTIAADLTIYPIGTIMYIPGYGYGVVADKGGAINGYKIDLYYETVEDVYTEWGKKEVDVYIIELGNGQLTEEQLVSLNANESLQVFREQILSES